VTLPTCCLDLEILPEHLLFPDRLDQRGREFVDAHGLTGMTLAELRATAKPVGRGLVRIEHRCQHLQDDGRCAIYASRPAICREFDCKLRKDCACRGRGRMD
jgi:Fe-S-cluster containining protein